MGEGGAKNSRKSGDIIYGVGTTNTVQWAYLISIYSLCFV